MTTAKQVCAGLRVSEDLELGMAELQRIMQVRKAPCLPDSAPVCAAAAHRIACNMYQS